MDSADRLGSLSKPPVSRRTRPRIGRSLASWFVSVPEQLARRTTAKQRRVVHFWLTVLWLTAGTVLWIFIRNILWFVGLMSLYAIWVTHLAGWSAETPAEVEEDPTPQE
jgi:hypothetical protein